ncbi:MAG: hypothetical protein LBH01_06755 [Verrucomicrobiales bacterium]|nr:hypothetical protein [Verrucomicrobiales bacterium]
MNPPKNATSWYQLASLLAEQPVNHQKARKILRAQRERRKDSKAMAAALNRAGCNPYRYFTDQAGNQTRLQVAYINNDDPTEGWTQPVYRNCGLIPDVQVRRNEREKNLVEYGFDEGFDAHDNLRSLTVTGGAKCTIDELVERHQSLHDDFVDLRRLAWFKKEAEPLLVVHEETLSEEDGRIYYNPHIHIIYRLKQKRLPIDWEDDLIEYLLVRVHDQPITDLKGIINYCFKLTDYSLLLDREAELAAMYKAYSKIRRFEKLGSLKKIISKLNADKMTPRKVGIDKSTHRPIWELIKQTPRPKKKPQPMVVLDVAKDLDFSDVTQPVAAENTLRPLESNLFVGWCQRWSKDGKQHIFCIILNPEWGLYYEEIYYLAKIPLLELEGPA